jgi:hypothetical protein
VSAARCDGLTLDPPQQIVTAVANLATEANIGRPLAQVPPSTQGARAGMVRYAAASSVVSRGWPMLSSHRWVCACRTPGALTIYSCARAT